MTESLRERTEKYARWYLENVCELKVLEAMTDDDGLRGFIAREREGDDVAYHFVYLSFHTQEHLQRWASEISCSYDREVFERDMVRFFEKGDPRTGEVCYGELRALVLGEDRAIFKFRSVELFETCDVEVCA